MAQRHLYRDIDGTLTDMSAYAPRLNWIAQSKAEEAAYGSWTVTLDDPNGELDILGHRQWFVEDDESEDDDDIIFGGFTGAQTFARADGDQRRKIGPQARVVTIELIDANTWLSRIIMKGNDCNRTSVETDIERLTWLFGTAEAGLLADTSTFFSTVSPRNMDKADLRGTYLGQIIADCASASGKNHFAWYRKVGGVRTLTLWYGRDGVTSYPSPFYLSNDLADLDRPAIEAGTADVWELSADAKMVRSPERQYCGNLVSYGDKMASTYRHNADTHALIASYGSGHRDMTSSFPLVKKKTTAQARGDRQLEDVEEQDVRITTRMERVPATRVTLAKAGMRLQVKGTHWAPTCDDWHYARILSAQPKPRSKGDLYDIDLELALGDSSSGPPVPPFTGKAFAGAQGADGNLAPLVWDYSGDSPAPGFNANPTVGPLSAILASGVYTQLTTSRDITVRVSAAAGFAAVFSAGGHCTMTCTSSVNGVIGTDTITSVGGGFVSGNCIIEVTPYDMVAGEILTFAGSFSGVLAGGGWGQAGDNNTYIRIGRGTHNWGSGGAAEVWVGP